MGNKDKSKNLKNNFFKYKIQRLENNTFGINLGIKIEYPFYTFEKDIYSEFMINFLNCLEFRQYPTNFTLANELEECFEILFIEKGSYNIGY